jgi:hypothetical protein
MPVHFVTFGSDDYAKQVERITTEARNTGWFASVQGLYTRDLDKDFLDKHSTFLHGRGYGYWIWKPQVILQSLLKLNDNEVLVYADSGCTINKKGTSRFLEYIDYAKHPTGIVCFQMPQLPEFHWTKSEVFMELGMEQYNTPQVCATYSIIRKCQESIRIVEEWSRLTQQYTLINDSYTVQPHPGFKDHRHDQSIWSILNKNHKTYIIVGDEPFPPGNEKIPIWATRIRRNELSRYSSTQI